MLLHLYAVSVVSLVTLGIGLGLVYGTPSVMGTLDEVKKFNFQHFEMSVYPPGDSS